MTTTKTVQARMTSKGLRIWLEGNDLINAGFSHGTTMAIDYTSNSVIIWSHADIPMKGRKVAGTPSRPIIDLQSKALSKIFNEGMVAIDFFMGSIKITQGE
jgi:hypothetical protein